MTMLNSVYVAWQAPVTHDWHVVGNLQERNVGYVFNYTKGALSSNNFMPFSGMNDLYGTYVSDELFPLFKNRILSTRRPEYPHFIKWLGLKDEEATPLEVLGRSGGLRSTDQLQVFKKIELDTSNYFEHSFFIHAVNYMSESAKKRMSELSVGEKLQLCVDSQNDYDDFAVCVRVNQPPEIIGYCPRYFAEDIKAMLSTDPRSISLKIEAISDGAPSNYQLLCRLSGQVNDDVANQLKNRVEFQHICGL
ncbi:HIRAN domain-containing protein [Yersinia enterocolitica]|uniref:HIRAN domain-containing protein n=1 Tax=Yersinia enterocolitica TaxID=630 RepID=UPI00061CD86A|nr:HIRAN domain-containing protein [Yersinia enterocolitica]EKN6181548.1 restriction endonuclease [Yersinia enterocolitica]EKN6394795.1 restriction endonuclease [Yersinia enterocolitica]ELW8961611.1 HIRAN domain-containing protein [Yersinia enterocolitica]CNB55447.1 Uncharacterised protein [Yersinia enterocolitica]HDL6679906.1 HIRAN domain-containing protein [Yersinia enterocolitica]